MEQLKHECGIALIRLLKPITYYEQKYGTARYGIDKLYLMMEKQHNRGQEGAGVAGIDLEAQAGSEYMFRERAEGKGAITEVFSRFKPQSPIANCQLLMGHLRYSTTGRNGICHVHPLLRRNGWRAKNLCICGNFNMTNIDEVFQHLEQKGMSPRIYGDAYITLELMGHRLDREVERLYTEATGMGLQGTDITSYIDSHVCMDNVLQQTMPHFDGGYVMCGLTGSGEMFAMRDPNGIRTAYFYQNDEMVVVASERPVIQTCFDLPAEVVSELQPGQALVVNKNGETYMHQILAPRPLSACSFERIYFSRGSDGDIYRERKRLGEMLAPKVLEAIDGDVAHTVFSYIPNTAEVAFYGLTDGVRRLTGEIRMEKVVWKDIKLRTFIADRSERNDLAAHVYDITYGSLRPHTDQLVIIDDSIVRGTTLKESIFKILDRLHPTQIVMVSSAPQVRYPDYYGIDMSRLEELCAFRAAIELLKACGKQQLIRETYHKCKTAPLVANHVRDIYAPFTPEQISSKIAEMLRPEQMQTPVELVFQSIEGLHEACPNHTGDWYFTGHYPTPGGIQMVNQAFVNYIDIISKT